MEAGEREERRRCRDGYSSATTTPRKPLPGCAGQPGWPEPSAPELTVVHVAVPPPSWVGVGLLALPLIEDVVASGDLLVRQAVAELPADLAVRWHLVTGADASTGLCRHRCVRRALRRTLEHGGHDLIVLGTGRKPGAGRPGAAADVPGSGDDRAVRAVRRARRGAGYAAGAHAAVDLAEVSRPPLARAARGRAQPSFSRASSPSSGSHCGSGWPGPVPGPALRVLRGGAAVARLGRGARGRRAAGVAGRRRRRGRRRGAAGVRRGRGRRGGRRGRGRCGRAGGGRRRDGLDLGRRRPQSRPSVWSRSRARPSPSRTHRRPRSPRRRGAPRRRARRRRNGSSASKPS